MGERNYLDDVFFFQIKQEEVINIQEMKDLLTSVHKYNGYLPPRLGFRLDFMFSSNDFKEHEYNSIISFTLINIEARFERVLFDILFNLNKPYPLRVGLLDDEEENEYNSLTELIAALDSFFNNEEIKRFLIDLGAKDIKFAEATQIETDSFEDINDINGKDRNSSLQTKTNPNVFIEIDDPVSRSSIPNKLKYRGNSKYNVRLHERLWVDKTLKEHIRTVLPVTAKVDYKAKIELEKRYINELLEKGIVKAKRKRGVTVFSFDKEVPRALTSYKTESE